MQLCCHICKRETCQLKTRKFLPYQYKGKLTVQPQCTPKYAESFKDIFLAHHHDGIFFLGSVSPFTSESNITHAFQSRELCIIRGKRIKYGARHIVTCLQYLCSPSHPWHIQTSIGLKSKVFFLPSVQNAESQKTVLSWKQAVIPEVYSLHARPIACRILPTPHTVLA